MRSIYCVNTVRLLTGGLAHLFSSDLTEGHFIRTSLRYPTGSLWVLNQVREQHKSLELEIVNCNPGEDIAHVI
jgi:hypothetical protein